MRGSGLCPCPCPCPLVPLSDRATRWLVKQASIYLPSAICHLPSASLDLTTTYPRPRTRLFVVPLVSRLATLLESCYFLWLSSTQQPQPPFILILSAVSSTSPTQAPSQSSSMGPLTMVSTLLSPTLLPRSRSQSP